MGNMKCSKLSFIIASIFFVLATAACSKKAATPTANPALGIYTVDLRFEECYKYLGGEDKLGVAITPIFRQGGILYQYTKNVLLKYDPEAPSIQRCQLVPLGLQWGIMTPKEPKPEKGDAIYANGHVVWDEVAPYYAKYGSSIIGLPLTDVHYNSDPKKIRYEQYFENMGFYRNVDEPRGTVHLMPYGSWMCAKGCVYQVSEAIPERLPALPSEEALRLADEYIQESANRLGLDITGYPLTAVYVAPDGKYEKVYENVVLVSDPESPARVYFRPITQSLGIQPGNPVPKGDEQGSYFFPVKDELGYNVRGYFMDYITAHGGMENSGMPISEEIRKSNTISRQCFTNLCLDYQRDAPEGFRIRPAGLGYTYKDLNLNSPKVTASPTATPSMRTISLQVWERYPLVSSKQNQEIGVAIFENNIPLPKVDFQLILNLPDGTQQTHLMEATRQNGQTSFKLDPISAPNGTLVPYQVCMLGLPDMRFCVRESFIIWDNP